MDVRTTTASEMVRTKIERNNVTKQLLKTQISAIAVNLKSLAAATKTFRTQIRLIDAINAVEELQLSEYSLEREAVVNQTTYDIHELANEHKAMEMDARKAMEAINKKIVGLYVEMQRLSDKIPPTGVALNIRIRNQGSGSCAQQTPHH
jgi:hypothetical protein